MEHASSSRAKRGTKKVWTVRTTASPISLYRDGRITSRELFRLYVEANADEMPRNLPRWIRREVEKLRSNGTGQPAETTGPKNGRPQEAIMPHALDKNRDQNGARAGQTATPPLARGGADRLTPYDLHDELLGLMSHPKRETPYCDRPRIPRSGMSPMDVAERMDSIFEDT